MNTHDIDAIAQLTKKYALTKSLGVVAVLSEDVGGMTYVGRWIKSDVLEDVPEGISWDEISKLTAGKNK
jgi:hypothetical protein